MTRVIECYYSLSSPWAYFGGPRFREIAEKHEAAVVLRPYDFLEVVPHNGGVPLRTRPQPRQDYHALELDRWRKYLEMPLNLKPRFYPPRDNKAAGRTVIAAQQRRLDAMALSHALLKALWAEEQDIADPATRARIADGAGMDGKALVEAEESDPVVAEYRSNTDLARERGVFGAPTYVYEGVPYWGQDRLFFLDRHLSGIG
jgi:2-hydroxychromene-2-carboxylate isomerase